MDSQIASKKIKDLKSSLKGIIEFQEVKCYVETYGELPEFYWGDVKVYRKFIRRQFPTITKAKINLLELSVILSEFAFIYDHHKRVQNIVRELNPRLISGARAMVRGITYFNKNPDLLCNVIIEGDEIERIKLRGSKEIIEQKVPIKIRAPGRIVNRILITALEDSALDELKNLAAWERTYSRRIYKEAGKRNVKSCLRNRLSKSLYHYIKRHFPDYPDNQVFLFGGKLLHIIGLMPEPRKRLDTRLKFDRFCISNFKKAYRSTN